MGLIHRNDLLIVAVTKFLKNLASALLKIVSLLPWSMDQSSDELDHDEVDVDFAFRGELNDVLDRLFKLGQIFHVHLALILRYDHSFLGKSQLS